MWMTDSIGFRAAKGLRAALVVVSLAGLTGCYRTAELSTPVPAPGTRIVAELTPTGAERIEALIGADAVGLEARVAEVRPEAWELSVLRVDHRGSSSIPWNGERVVIPTDALRSVRERQLDTLRTSAFVGGLGVTLLILARNFMGAWISGSDGDGRTDPPH
jgi:hypothetical protein